MNEKKVAVLLHGPVHHDGRVIKMIRTMSRWASVDLFYLNGKQEDRTLFNSKVRLFSLKQPSSTIAKWVRHSFFYKEFDFMAAEVLQQGIAYDWIYCNDLPTLHPGIRIKRKLGSRLLYDSHEIYIETINQFFPRNRGGIKGSIFDFLIGFMRTTGGKFEAKAIRLADAVLTVNESLAVYFAEKYQLRTRPTVVYNCPDKQFLYSSPRNLREEWMLPNDAILLLYQGVLNEGRGLRLMIEALQELDKKFHLLIVGDGPLKGELQKLSHKLELQSRVHFIGRVAYEDLSSYTRSADIGINLLENTNLSKSMALANKLFEYIHSGIPVLSSNTPEHRKIYDKYRIGELTLNGTNEISQGIEKIWQSKKEYSIALMAAKEAYNWECQEISLLEALNLVPD